MLKPVFGDEPSPFVAWLTNDTVDLPFNFLVCNGDFKELV